jgi:hypothetical protein
MKLTNFLQTFAFAMLLGSAVMMVSCKDDDTLEGSDVGTVTGTVTDLDTGAPIPGVTVAVTGINETATTGSDGKYTVANVTIESHAVSFSKAGWLTISVTVTAGKFDADKVVTVNITMQNASASIQGTVLDGANGNVPLAGVTVSIGPGGTATTGATGAYVIENLIVDDYTVTFAKTGYKSIEKNITKNEFVNNVATVNVTVGGTELLRGKTAFDLANADKWYFDEYTGGRNGDAYPHWDWSTDYMGTLDFWGNFEEQNEGSTLRIRNDDADRSNPADLEVFDSYVYGSKKITNDNKILTLRVRTHNADNDAPALFGVQVIDLSVAEPTAVKVGAIQTHGSGDYADYDFDLSAYVGKEVVVAAGIYRAQTGDYWKQLVLRRIAFAPQKTENWDWLPGTEITGLEGWHLTLEMVRSMMANPLKSFSGVSPVSGNRDNYIAAYRAWREMGNHLATNWYFVPVNKDPEPFPGEGFIIKTRGSSTPVNTTLPEAYFTTKFAVTADNDQFTLKTRNFGSNYTFFKLTAIKEDGTVTHLAPVSNTATTASPANDGCWKFKHDNGGAGSPDAYASFVYNLTQFNGNNVVLCIGVYKGENNEYESKLCFFNISLE